MTHTHALTHSYALICRDGETVDSLKMLCFALLSLSLSLAPSLWFFPSLFHYHAFTLFPPHKHRSFPLYWCINNFCALIESLCLWTCPCVRECVWVCDCLCGCLGMCVTCISQINWSLVSHNIVEKTSWIFTPFACACFIYLLITCAAFFLLLPLFTYNKNIGVLMKV